MKSQSKTAIKIGPPGEPKIGTQTVKAHYSSLQFWFFVLGPPGGPRLGAIKLEGHCESAQPSPVQSNPIGRPPARFSSICLCLFVSGGVYVCLSVSVCAGLCCLCVSVSVRLCQCLLVCLCVCVHVYMCLSVWMCLPVPARMYMQAVLPCPALSCPCRFVLSSICPTPSAPPKWRLDRPETELWKRPTFFQLWRLGGTRILDVSFVNLHVYLLHNPRVPPCVTININRVRLGGTRGSRSQHTCKFTYKTSKIRVPPSGQDAFWWAAGCTWH